MSLNSTPKNPMLTAITTGDTIAFHPRNYVHGNDKKFDKPKSKFHK